MNPNPFTAQALSLPISVTSTASTSTALPNRGNCIRIVNEGPNIAFVSIGTGTQVATLPNATPNATSCPVAVGDCVLGIHIPSDGSPANISAICRSAQTATLTVQVGEGL